MQVKNMNNQHEVKDITLSELHEQLIDAIDECGKDSEVFFRFNNKYQFIVKGIYISKCDCCDQNLPLIYGELME